MQASLVGIWKLMHTESIGADGSTMAPPYGGEHGLGLLTFTANGRMACVLCDSRAEMPADTRREYNSYCGAYVFDGQQLCTTVDACSIPHWLGTDQVRAVSYEGDLLVLRPPQRAYASQPEQRVLYWRKMSD
jgi:hypothetical protein